MKHRPWNRVIIALGLGLLGSLTGCRKDDSGEWLILEDEVFDGGPGKDGIPALALPSFIPASEADYLLPDDLVVGYRVGTEIKAYPHRILDWHEIANDALGDQKFAMTYCPLTGSALAWNRVIAGTTTSFGVSGLLYRNNLMPYDRATDSYWSQLRMDCVNGELIGTAAELFTIVETTWESWQAMYPNSEVMSNNTGIYSEAQYGFYPYGSYRTDTRILFPLPAGQSSDTRLHPKERVAGVAGDGAARVYRFGSFADSVRVIQDFFAGDSLVVVGSDSANLLMIFNRRLQDGTTLTFSPVQGQLPIIMQDSEGTAWDVFGRGASGPRTGQQLDSPPNFIAYWFAWAAFFTEQEIFEYVEGGT